MLAAQPAAAAVRVTGVRALPASAVAGRTIALRVTTKPAKARLRMLLSKDAKAGKGDVALAALKRHGAKVTGRVPATVRPGRYRVLACPVVRHPRCAAAKGRLTVTSPPAPALLPAPAPAPASVLPSLGNDVVVPVPVDLPSFDAPPAPRDVTPQLDTARAATATIGLAGGTLHATGADGSTFTLTIPAGALPDDVPITMTPVAAIPDLPFTAAPPAAVQLVPDGLQLAQPATLKVVPAHAAPAGEQVAFGWHGAGQSLFLEPVRGGALELWHFSGGGLGGAIPAQAAAQQQAVPAFGLDRFLQQLAADPPDPVGVAVAFYDAQVATALTYASTHADYVTSAVQQGVAWSHDVAALGMKGDPRIDARLAQVLTALVAALTNGFADARDRCMAGHVEQIGRMLSLARLAASLGLSLGDPLADTEKCARFSLDYDYTGTFHEDGGRDGVIEWKADDVPLRIDASGTTWSGTQQLTFVRWQYPINGHTDCSIADAGYGTARPLTATLSLSFAPQTKLDPATGREIDDPHPPAVKLVLDPGSPYDGINITCGTHTIYDATDIYWNAWENLHGDEFSLDTRMFTLTNWATAVTEPFAQYGRGRDSTLWGDDGSLALTHTPGAS